MKTTTKANINQASRNVGIDVGKSALDIYLFELDLHWQSANSEDQIACLVRRLARYKLTRIVVEATGGYERKLVYALAERGLPVVVVQPMQVRQYAKAQGVLAKTDKMDAKLLAEFAVVMKPEIRPIQTKKNQVFQRLIVQKTPVNGGQDSGAESNSESRQAFAGNSYTPSQSTR